MEPISTSFGIRLSDVQRARYNIQGVVHPTLLAKNFRLSQQFEANILLKREDLQIVRSYKIRGAFNKISSLDAPQKKQGVVCASAGNHAQGVAYACQILGIHAHIFMPSTTPKQKVDQVKYFGGEWVEVVLTGDTFDDSQLEALDFCTGKGKVFVPPFDDPMVIAGQGTIGLEILEQYTQPIDYVLLPVGGGGLASGVSTVLKQLSPQTKIIGIEPHGADAMRQSIQEGKRIILHDIDTFVDGAAVKQVGELNFNICQQHLDKVITVDEGRICETIVDLYNKDAIVVEPSGAMCIAALHQLQAEIQGKTVVCLVSGSNNDLSRMEEIKERALLYKGLKHYFVVVFPQRAGALKEFVADVLGPNDDITYFQYTKKTSRESGAAVIGIELKEKRDFEPLVQRMNSLKFFGRYLNDDPNLLSILV
ncbi:MAG: threonine ammonia-lyase [Bacteroidota bacterium]